MTHSHYTPKPKLLPQQPGERVKSIFSGGEKFKQLLIAVADESSKRTGMAEMALVTRARKSGAAPTCLTIAFQALLQEEGIIAPKNDNVNRAVPVNSDAIPTTIAAIKSLASDICDRLPAKAEEIREEKLRAKLIQKKPEYPPLAWGEPSVEFMRRIHRLPDPDKRSR